ncbi:glycosyltransferase family 4 protein [Edaphobacter aggregans]|uniref:glycosyltransferase family 4 protein n=1 Tax=Edaphobacter aggregans TaxID=570835 RepID=UPI000555C96D|nr:glycosyltransferase family 4 protein [Edaphobacter aggregans]
MKIAMCAPADLHALARFCGQDVEGVPPGLGSTATTPLIEELLRRGHEVTLFTLSNELAKETRHEWGGLRVFTGPSRHYGAARNLYWPEVAYLRRVIAKERPAFVHAHWTYEFALGALTLGIPLLTTIHDLPWNVLRQFRDRCRTVRLLIAYLVALRCHRYTAVSEDAANHFRRYFKPGGDIEIIPNFLKDSIFEVGHGMANSDRPFTFGTILSNWSIGKNGHAALKAFHAVSRVAPESRLIMMGTDYEQGGPAHRWARQHGLDARVTFAGMLPHEQMLRRVRDDVDVIVHPSLYEAFSMAVLESMALAKPIVAGYSTPGMRQALLEGDAGVLVDVRDSGAIARAMISLMTDSSLNQRVARNAYQHVSSAYRKDSIVPRYEEIYGRMAYR